jgi:hypothetical protein
MLAQCPEHVHTSATCTCQAASQTLPSSRTPAAPPRAAPPAAIAPAALGGVAALSQLSVTWEDWISERLNLFAVLLPASIFDISQTPGGSNRLNSSSTTNKHWKMSSTTPIRVSFEDVGIHHGPTPRATGRAPPIPARNPARPRPRPYSYPRTTGHSTYGFYPTNHGRELIMTPGQAGILRSQSVHHSAARQEQIRAQFFLSPPEDPQAGHLRPESGPADPVSIFDVGLGFWLRDLVFLPIR